MNTFLFHDIVFGPIHSRRLGTSLGVNLSPKDGKWCNFNCVYCECGWNEENREDTRLPSKDEVFNALETTLSSLHRQDRNIDTITFSGNGEPTLHPDFPEIIDFTLNLRNKYFKNAKISVLTNATRLEKESVTEALKKIENPILKIDSCSEDFIKLVDNPQAPYSLEKVLKSIESFNGNFILQTMFLRGVINGIKVDSTDKDLVDGWLNIVRKIKPREIMVYTLNRETPLKSLEKVSVEEMRRITEPLVEEGYKVQISG